MTTNKNIVEDFVLGCDDIKTENLFVENRILYSYGYHFPLCIRLHNGFIVNTDGYSQTTAQHKGILIREITNEDTFKQFEKAKEQYPNIILMDTEKIKSFVDLVRELNLKTMEDIKNYMILNNL